MTRPRLGDLRGARDPASGVGVLKRPALSALCLATAALGLLAACLPWSVRSPALLQFVSNGLSEEYGLALEADGPAEIALLPLPRLNASRVRLTAGPSGPLIARDGTLSLQFSLLALFGGRIEVAALALDGSTVILQSHEGDDRWVGPLARLSEHVSGNSAAAPRRITLGRTTLVGRDPRDGSPQTAREVDLAFSWPLLRDSLDIAAGFTWNGAAVRLVLKGVNPRELALGQTSPFMALATWPAGTLNAEGSLGWQGGWHAKGQASIDVRSVPETLAWAGGGLALSPLVEDLGLEASFEAKSGSFEVPNLRVRAGDNVLEGAGSATFGASRAGIQATLAADTLNLSPLLAGLMHLTGLDNAAEDGRWTRQSLALAPLTRGDLDLRISAGSARLGPLVLEDLASSILVREDGIEASLARAGLRGGTLKGRLILAQGRDGDTDLRTVGTVDGIDLGALLELSGAPAWMAGETRGSFAFEGRGADVAALCGRLNGRTTLTVESGTLTGLDLNDVVHRGGAVAQGALARRNGRTPFERAALSIRFADGIGEIAEGVLSARALEASLRGRISLPDRRLSAEAELQPRGAEGAGRPATLFAIGGPWDAVAVERVHREGGSDTDPLSGAFERRPVPTAAIPGLSERVRAYAP
ncbi:hypothetical protein LKMONMHP_0868 [Methylobacterium organophilum]|uniref:AsmA domain-containing protein n=1 Tax=Methylobacterium organophilum TaxID=410 RepID=A0ABQ4T4Y2_METOR|nr:hypothetical protein LKMONMHP_0868 [Methylobacterium organophilum]